MNSPRRPWWQQATALVSLGAGGAVTGFAFVPGTADQIASPASVPVTLTALDQAAQPARADDSAVRSAIVSVANYYLRMAQTRTPAEMEALIWQQDSTDGADHGESCAAFASMTLELGAQVVGRHSWVTGGSSYPWPLHEWADVRVDPNPDSPGITSVLQDAEAHQRWHPLGDGYEPLPGDWVLFNGHVEVVTKYSGGVLSTIGGDSLPNFSVNAHEYSGSLAADGVVGFVSNGNLPVAAGSAGQSTSSAAPGAPAARPPGASKPSQGRPAASRGSARRASGTSVAALADIPGTAGAAPSAGVTMAAASTTLTADSPAIPGVPASAAGGSGPGRSGQPPAPASSATGSGTGTSRGVSAGTAAVAGGQDQAGSRGGAGQTVTSGPAIPGLPGGTSASSAGSAPSPYQRSQPPAGTASAPGTAAQLAFINQVAPGAIAAQKTYGVPAAVTIAQAIDESAWGQSTLAAQDNNLFGIKGTGPAGSVSLPTQEFENGQWVSITAQFAVYNNLAESIADHGKLLATSGYYSAAMAVRQAPNSFAQALTGVYATNPEYGSDLVGLMRRYNLYRFDPDTRSATAQAQAAAHPASASAPASTVPRTAYGSAGQADIPGFGMGAQPAHAAATASAGAASRGTASPSPAPSGHVSSSPASGGATGAPRTGRTSAPAPPAPARGPKTVTPRATAAHTSTIPAPTVPAQAHAGRPAPNGQGATTARGTATRPPAVSAPVTAAPPAGRARAATSPAGGSGSGAGALAEGAAPAPPAPARAASSGVPHPFATPQPAASSARSSSGPRAPGAPAPTSAPSSPSPSPASPTGRDGADIPGFPAGPSGTEAGTAHTSARVSSPSDTRVVAELTAAVRPAPRAETAPPRDTAAGQPPAGPPPAAYAQARAPETAADSGATYKKTHKKKTAAKTRKTAPRYQPQMPPAVKSAFLATARMPLAHAELIYRDVAGTCGISWKLLAACDWMQCEANPRYSPVQGEKLGTVNADGSVFRTKSEALTQCARELVAVADSVYHIDLTVPVELSILELANVFAAFRWGGLLKLHNTSAMEFPYSVQGLTDQHTSMRWPKIAEPRAPDKPGARFRRPFGAVPVVLSLDYPATV